MLHYGYQVVVSESQELTGNYNLTGPAELPDEPLSWAWLMGGALVTLCWTMSQGPKILQHSMP